MCWSALWVSLAASTRFHSQTSQEAAAPAPRCRSNTHIYWRPSICPDPCYSVFSADRAAIGQCCRPQSRNNLAEASRRNAEVVAAMGMARRLGAKWEELNQSNLDAHQRASDVAGGLAGLSKTARMALQSAVLGIGGYLVIQGEASAGIIIAGSILAARALAPVELVIVHWKGFVSARQSWARLRDLLASSPEPAATLSLRKPASRLSAEAVSVVPPGDQRLVVREVSFSLDNGSALGIVGPSASGKSSLARQTRATMADGRLVHPAAAFASQSCVVLRLHRRPHTVFPLCCEMKSGITAIRATF